MRQQTVKRPFSGAFCFVRKDGRCPLLRGEQRPKLKKLTYGDFNKMFHEDRIDAFRLKERLAQSSSLIQAGILGFYGLNAFLTFVYCAFVVWFWLKPELDFTGLAGFAIVTLLFGGATLLLLDGARALWAAGRVAQNTTSYQQKIAWVMEVLNFVGSLLASVIALRFIWQIFGTTQVTAVESGTESMTTLLTAALTINLIAAFFYNQLSVTARQLQTVARAGAKFSDELTTGLAVLLQDAKSDVPALLEPYAASLKDRHANDAVNKVLATYGYDPSQDQNIIDVTPEEEEPPRYSVHYLNSKGEQCNTAVIDDLEDARVKATELALEGMTHVRVKDFDGNPVWPKTAALNRRKVTAAPPVEATPVHGSTADSSLLATGEA